MVLIGQYARRAIASCPMLATNANISFEISHFMNVKFQMRYLKSDIPTGMNI